MLVRVVVETKAQSKKRPGKLARELRKRIRTRDAAPRGTIESYVAGSSDQTHVRHVASFRDGKFNRQFSLSAFVRFGNQTELILLDYG